MHFYFWQTIVSHQMMALADGLVELGCEVTYVAERALTPDRVALGWQDTRSARVEVVIADNKDRVDALVNTVDGSVVHVCQGLRGNWFTEYVVAALDGHGRRYWVCLETLRNRGVMGWLRRRVYARLLSKRNGNIAGILAIGHQTTDWVVARGFPADQVHPFAYFMTIPQSARIEPAPAGQRPVRFVFVGQFIPRKRLALLIDALGDLADPNFELMVIGSGELEHELRKKATERLAGRVRWAGVVPAPDVAGHLARADCLVLPSSHDGWGTVVSEALIVGTPVICSEACGAAAVVRASGAGGVFAVEDAATLRSLLSAAVKRGAIGPVDRARLRSWGRCLGGRAGATYLLALAKDQRRDPPWRAASPIDREPESAVGA